MADRLTSALTTSASFAVVGDVHGHLQLALCTLARWQRVRGRPFSAVFLCGDVGTFTEDAQLDNATRRHARDNPCELEFLTQWSADPQPPWLDAIFWPEPDGLALNCPVVMVHGNHEGFAHLETLFPRRRPPADPLPLADLPPVDTAGRIRLLPPGWLAGAPGGYTVAGVGGIEPGQRRVNYHPMAYLDEGAVEHLLVCAPPPVDVLLTHQGPASVQGDHGSPMLDLLLESNVARFWFHGHSTPVHTPVEVGGTRVVPLGDVAFSNGTPGLSGWAVLDLEGGPEGRAELTHEPPPSWREARRHHWHQTRDGLLVHPELVRFMGTGGRKA